MRYTFVHKSKLERAALMAHIKDIKTIGELKAVLEYEFHYTAKKGRYRPRYTAEEHRYIHEVMPLYTLILWRITVEKGSKVPNYYLKMGTELSEYILMGILSDEVGIITEYEQLRAITQNWEGLYRCGIRAPIYEFRRLSHIIGGNVLPFPSKNLSVVPQGQLRGAYYSPHTDLSQLIAIRKELNTSPTDTLWKELYSAALADVHHSGRRPILDKKELYQLEKQVLGDLAEAKPDVVIRKVPVNDGY